MQDIYIHHILDLTNNTFVQFNTIQGDGDRVRGITFELIANNAPYVLDANVVNVAIGGTKPDGTTILNDCVITEDGYVSVDITSQMTAVAGRGEYQLYIISKTSDSQLKSYPFYIFVNEASVDIENITSSDEFKTLTNALSAMEKSSSLIEESIELANSTIEKLEDAIEACENSSNEHALSARQSAQEASNSAISANENAILSQSSATNAKVSENNAQISESNASISADFAIQSATSAESFANTAKNYAEKAKMYAENASAVTNVQIATKDIAGLVKGGDNHIAEDGTLVLTDRTDSGLLQPSHAGGIRLHSISAVEDRQVRTTGAQLFDASAEYYANKGGSISVESKGKNIKVSGIQARAKIIYTLDVADFIGKKLTLSGKISKSLSSASVFAGLVIITSEGTKYTTLTVGDFNTTEYTIPETTTGLTLEFTPNDTSSDLSATNTMTIEDFMMSSNGVTIWEPYTGGKPSPAPGEPVVTSANQLKLNGTTQTVNGVTVTFDMANQFVVFSGDPTADAEFTVGTAKLEAGTWYANAICMPNAATIFEYSVTDANGNTLLNVEANTEDVNVSETFTLTEAQTVTFKFMLPSGESIDQEFMFAIVADANADWDEYTVEYTEGYPQAIEGTVMKNLLENTAISQTVHGVKFDVNGDKSISISTSAVTSTNNYNIGVARLKKGERYLFTADSGTIGTDSFVIELTNGMETLRYVGTELLITPTEDTEYTVYVRYYAGAVINKTIYPMIRPAEILDDTYVPYGCTRVVGKGNNLFNKDRVTQGRYIDSDGKFATDQYWGTSDYIYLPKGIYTISGIKTVGTNPKRVLYDLSGKLSRVLDIAVAGDYTFETDEDMYLMASVFLGHSNNVGDIDTMQIELGEVATPFFAYVEQSTILSHPFSELHNIGGVSDGLTPNAEVRRFATVVFDGSEDEDWVAVPSNVSGKYRIRNQMLKNAIVKTQGIANSLCNQFDIVSAYDTWICKNGLSIDTNGWILIYSDSFDTKDITLWKAYLAAHPMTVVYELATEQVTPLPTADQIALHSLKSYDGVTHLYTDTYPQMVIDCEWGTSKVGGYVLENYNVTKRNEITLQELTSAILVLNQE